MQTTRHTRLELMLLLPLLFLFAWATQDPAAAACTDRGGVVFTDPPTRTSPRTYGCIVDGQTVDNWRRNGDHDTHIWGH